jgi:chemotaxis signal transduction protein
MSDKSIIVFKIMNVFCGVEALSIREILNYQEPQKIDSDKQCLLGEIELRGEKVEIVSLPCYFNNVHNEITGEERFLIVEADGTRIGFLVDEVLGIEVIHSNKLENTPALIVKQGSEHIVNVGIHKDKIVNIIDLVGIAKEG